MLRVTCFMKSLSALSVIPRISTLRVAMRMAKSTKNVRRPFGVHISTWKKSAAARVSQ